jgi:hypothetical protein
MNFDREIEAFIKAFVKDLEGRNVAIFAGAGMSKMAGYVDWHELLHDIAEELGLSVDKEHDLISLAQYHVNHKGSNSALAKKILEEFSEQAEESETHRILARLPIPAFWTTNYDNVIESSLERAYKVVDVKHSVTQLTDSKPKRDVVVYKMHGDATLPRGAVISKEQYEDYHRDHSAFITTLSSDLISKTFLFIGFSFSDPNLDYVLSRLRLSAPIRDHYCFMRKVVKSSNEDQELFRYRLRKQELKIADLKRYRIQVLQIDEYSDIPKILLEIERRFRKKTVFISGSAEEYGEWGRQESQAFIHALSKQIIESNFRIVNGFGWGVGSAVINGALEGVYGNPKKFSEDQLIIRPFPQFETTQKKLPELWEDYRQRMMGLAGIAIFVFGNKKDDTGNIISANGVIREFQIAIEHGLVPIPIAASGYASLQIYNEISQDPKKFYGDDIQFFDFIKEFASTEITPAQILKKVGELLKLLAK